VTNSLVEVLYQVLLFIRDLIAMVCACLIKVGYYCWVTTRFALLILRTFITSIEKENREQSRVKLGLMPIYAFNDFADAKRYLNPLPDLGKFSVKILLDEENKNIMSCN